LLAYAARLEGIAKCIEPFPNGFPLMMAHRGRSAIVGAAIRREEGGKQDVVASYRTAALLRSTNKFHPRGT